jgi:maltose alpha-D-glucosyltransferase/alpha-amylase
MPTSDPQWYKDALFYEVNVRGFFDSNQDGNGDLRGLIEKLDYLHDLGVDCLWLMPIFASPLKDDGYDIADFRAIHPSLGTVEDFEELTVAAPHPWTPHHHRFSPQSHLRPTSVVSRGATR